MWDIRTKTSVGSIGSHTAPVWALKYSNNGKVIVSGG
jgi:WD40 repeat protein